MAASVLFLGHRGEHLIVGMSTPVVPEETFRRGVPAPAEQPQRSIYGESAGRVKLGSEIKTGAGEATSGENWHLTSDGLSSINGWNLLKWV